MLRWMASISGTYIAEQCIRNQIAFFNVKLQYGIFWLGLIKSIACYSLSLYLSASMGFLVRIILMFLNVYIISIYLLIYDEHTLKSLFGAILFFNFSWKLSHQVKFKQCCSCDFLTAFEFLIKHLHIKYINISENSLSSLQVYDFGCYV